MFHRDPIEFNATWPWKVWMHIRNWTCIVLRADPGILMVCAGRRDRWARNPGLDPKSVVDALHILPTMRHRWVYDVITSATFPGGKTLWGKRLEKKRNPVTHPATGYLVSPKYRLIHLAAFYTLQRSSTYPFATEAVSVPSLVIVLTFPCRASAIDIGFPIAPAESCTSYTLLFFFFFVSFPHGTYLRDKNIKLLLFLD